MKIAWVHNYSYSQYIGGAELTDYYWIHKAKDLGLKISEITHTDKNIKFGDMDLFVLGNISKIEAKYIKQIVNRPYISVFHGGLVNKEQLEIVSNAKVSVLISPAQQKKYQNLLNKTIIYLSPPYIDTALFRDKYEKREQNSYLYIGAIRKHKGVHLILKYAKQNPKKNFYFYGPTKDKEDFLLNEISNTKNCHYLGVLQNIRDVAETMNRYEKFIWFLDPTINGFESFGRTAGEALLSGMELEVKKKQLGIFSWDWDFSNTNTIASRLKEHYNCFWGDLLRYF